MLEYYSGSKGTAREHVIIHFLINHLCSSELPTLCTALIVAVTAFKKSYWYYNAVTKKKTFLILPETFGQCSDSFHSRNLFSLAV